MPQKVNEALVESIINLIMATTVAYSAEAYVKHMTTVVTHYAKTVSGVSLLVFLC